MFDNDVIDNQLLNCQSNVNYQLDASFSHIRKKLISEIVNHQAHKFLFLGFFEVSVYVLVHVIQRPT